MAKQHVEQFRDGRGRIVLERRGGKRSIRDTIGTDLYHFLRTATWTRIGLVFAAVFFGSNLVFAAVLYFGHAYVTTAMGFIDDFWFSIQTMGTIGYGVLSPGDTLSNVVVAIESFIGFGLTAMITGVFFARFATAEARVIFSTSAVVHQFDGKRTLMFRMANERATSIFEANVRVYLSRDETTVEGERIRRIHDLALKRNNTPVFALSWTAYHTLDETSPLFEMTAESIRATGMNLIVTFQGTDDRLAQSIHTRFAYGVEDILFDRKFADIVKHDPETKQRYLDLDGIHETVPLIATR